MRIYRNQELGGGEKNFFHDRDFIFLFCDIITYEKCIDLSNANYLKLPWLTVGENFFVLKFICSGRQSETLSWEEGFRHEKINHIFQPVDQVYALAHICVRTQTVKQAAQGE